MAEVQRHDAMFDVLGTLPSSTDVVVIGGGVAGTAAAYQLARRGMQVTLVEMRGICSGASGRNAGQTGSGGSSLVSKVGRAVHQITSENFRMLTSELPEELDDDFELRVTGSVDIATTPEQWEHLSESMRRLPEGAQGIRLIDGDELRRMIPAASEHILGAKYSERSGHLWPFKLVHAQANGARRHGARIFPWTPVQELLVEDGRVTGVATSRGVIQTDTVVLATNAWTPTLLPDLPEGAVVPARGQILVTQPVAPLLPLAFGTNFDKEYGRQTATGQLICGGFRRYDVDEGLGHYDEEVVAACLAGCAACLTALFPRVGPLRVVRGWAGIMGFTADGLPLIGPYAPAQGLYLSAGYNGGGFSWASAVGSILAQLITEGRVAYDLEPFDPNRFSQSGVSWVNPYTAGEKNNPRSVAELRASV